jgi:hypothetical protein
MRLGGKNNGELQMFPCVTLDFVNCIPMPKILTLDAIECNGKNTNEIHSREAENRVAKSARLEVPVKVRIR